MKRQIRNTLLELCRGDITRQTVDAIANAANTRLAGGGGVDGAIHRAGGPDIMAACRKIGRCPTGRAVITTAGRLPARHVIHTVGPVYRDGRSGEPELLASAYRSCLVLADQHRLKRIAFPSISTGVYGYPLREASRIALTAVIEYVQGPTDVEHVLMVLFSESDFQVYCSTLEALTGS